jgi:hypothetical protein
LGQLCIAVGLSALAVLIAAFAVPAFVELYHFGYGAATSASGELEYHPFTRVLVGVRVNTPAVPTGMARLEFNMVLRFVLGTISVIFGLILGSLASEGITVERVRDTLSGLLATPLTGPQILRAKMLGAIWRGRIWFVVQLTLVALGLLTGAVHPLGFLAVLLGLAISTWFSIALGTFGSLWARDLKQAGNYVSLPLTLIGFSAVLPLLLPSGLTTVWLGGLSPAWHCYLSLFSFDDVGRALRPGPYGTLSALGIQSGEAFGSVLGTCLVGWIMQVVAAAWLTRAAFRQFDEAVGRPIRPKVIETADARSFPVRIGLTSEIA